MEIEDVLKKLRGISWEDYDLVEDIHVDKYHLDIESEKMPMLIAKWNLMLSRASRKRDKAKERVKAVDAELFERAYKEKEGKTTDAAIKSWIISHPEHTRAIRISIDAESAVNYFWAAIRALEAKKESIAEESRLWSKNYFSRPTLSKEGMQKADEHMRTTGNDKVEAVMQKRTRKRKEI